MNEELEKYVDLIMSMSLSLKMNQIDEATYLTNLELIVKSISENKVLQ